MTVRFDTGFGDLREVDAPLGKIRLKRRDGGLDRFTERARWVGLCRLGVAAALLLPVLYFVVVYLWTFHTIDGLLPALVVAALDSAASMVDLVLTRPLQAAVFLSVSWWLGRFAFR
ncbi:hypothetical protein [Rhodococcus sp. NCIMB 12038]|uniref:hypothetical protein n=1 Tax=Rhodococcus sp. NCIMB 12038 TaxID=933800 RepID=UPI0015C5C295|nr:hypothetical protein [Rhodococcus sp. NCIMB 12038]